MLQCNAHAPAYYLIKCMLHDWESSYHITGDEGILVQKMTLFGAVGEFVEGEEDWAQYVERIGHFIRAHAS